MRPHPPSPLVSATLGLVAGLLLAPVDALALLPAPLLALDAGARALRPFTRGALLGWLLCAGGPAAPPPPPSWGGLPRSVEVEGRVRRAEPPARGARAFLLDVEALCDAPCLPPAPGAVALTLPTAGEEPEVLPGDRLRCLVCLASVPGPLNPGALDPRPAARRQGVSAWGRIADPRHVTRLERGTGAPAEVARLRARLAERLSATLPPEDAGLARALLLGDRGSLSAADQTRFRDTGQTHLVAVSGQHVALVLAGVLLLSRRLGARRRLSALLGLAAVALYVPLSGAAPSAVRSGLAASLWLLARLLGRRPAGLPLLAAVALTMLLSAPDDLGDAGFALSFGAVLGIEVLAPRLAAALIGERPHLPGLLEPPPARVRTALAVALAAWLGSAPLALVLLGQIHPLAAPLSLLAVPLAGALLGLAALTLVTAPLPPLCAAIALAFEGAAALLRRVLEAPAAAGFRNLEVLPPGPVWLALSTLALLLLGLGPRRLLRWAALAEALLLLHAITPVPAPPPSAPEVVVLDVGRAPALVLRLPDGRAALLLSAGSGQPLEALRPIRRALLALGVPRLDLALCTDRAPESLAALRALSRDVPIADLRHGSAWLDGLPPQTLLKDAWGRLEVLSASPPLGAARQPEDRAPVLALSVAGGSRLLWPTERGREGLLDLDLYLGDAARCDVLLLPARGLPDALPASLASRWSAARRVAVTREGRDGESPQAGPPWERGARVLTLGPVPRVRAWRPDEPEPAQGPYDRAPVPVTNAPPLTLLLGVAAALAAFAVLCWRPLGWLRPAGALGAWVLGVACFAAFHAPGLAALFAPFLVGTLLGKLPGAERDRGRTLRQVLANGMPAAVGAVIAALGHAYAGAAVMLGGLACLGSDTSATEIGTRYGGTPRSLLTGRPLSRGESGGVTWAGLGASVLGAALAPAAYALAAGAPPGTAFVGLCAAAGVLGALLDSLLGAGLQFRGRDPASGRITEKRRVEGRRPERVSGWTWLDNDAVNLVAGLAAGLVAWALLAA